MLTLAFSTGWPLASSTTPLTMPVDCAVAGSASASATAVAHAASHNCRRLNRRTITFLLRMRPTTARKCNKTVSASGAGPQLLIVQALDRVEAGSLHRRVHAENQPNQH